MPLLQHPNYLRIDGRAVLIVYQAASLKNIVDAAKLWRECAREQGLGELFLVNSHGFDTDPSLIGFDANLQDAACANGRIAENDTGKPTDEAAAFQSLLKKSYGLKRAKYPAFKTVWTGPANSPEVDSSSPEGSPAAYQEFLENICKSGRAGHSVGAPLFS